MYFIVDTISANEGDNGVHGKIRVKNGGGVKSVSMIDNIALKVELRT